MTADNLRRYFIRVLETDRLSHAYIIEGDPVIAARAVAGCAKILQCENHTGCGGCRPCTLHNAGTYPDTITVMHEKPATLSVDEVRTQLADDIMLKPIMGGRKIYVVPDAQMMTVQAQNAILKTLEEPPPYGVIFLLTPNAGTFLPTIISRCTCIRLTDVCNVADLVYGGGDSTRQSDSSDDPYRAYRLFHEVLKGADRSDAAQSADAVRGLKEAELSKDAAGAVLEAWLRDVSATKATDGSSKLMFYKDREDIARQAGIYSYGQLAEILRESEKLKERLAANVSFELSMTIMLNAMRPA